MSLLNDLREAGESIGVSHLPTPAEVSKVLAAAVGYLEHGDKFLDAARSGVDDLESLLSKGEVPAPAPTEPAKPVLSDADRVAELEAELAKLKGDAKPTPALPVNVPGPPVVDFANPTPAPPDVPDPEPTPEPEPAAAAEPEPEPVAPRSFEVDGDAYREYMDWRQTQDAQRATANQTALAEHVSGTENASTVLP